MHLAKPSQQAGTSTESTSIPDTHLHGQWLIIARSVWLVLVLLYCGLSLTNLLVYDIVLHGFQEGVYVHLISTPAVVNGYAAIASLYAPFTGPYATLNIVLLTFLSPFWIVVSLVIFWRRSDDWMALYVALFLVMLSTELSPASYVLLRVVGVTSFWGVFITYMHLLSWSSMSFFFVLFPDGRFVPGWTRWLTLAYLLWQVPLCMPTTWSFSIVHWPHWLLVSTFLGLVLAWAFAQLYRYRYVSTALQRQQTKWVVFGMMVGMLTDAANLLPPLIFPALTQLGSAHFLYTTISGVTLPLVFLLVPLTIGVSVLRYRLWDIDLIINRTLVYGLLTACVVVLYILVVVGLGTLFSAPGNLLTSLLATGLIAVLFQPLRERLQRAVNRLMFGERDDPYRVLLRLGQRLETTLNPEAVLPTIAETVAQALKLPYVAITWEQGEVASESVVAASYGKAGEHETPLHIPLVYQQEQVGELLLAPRSPGESLTVGDMRLLHDLAHQIGVAVHTVRLTADLQRLTGDLQRSRERLVAAREEERRRLRRNLHDGLGPRLAGLTLKLETARNRLAYDSLADTLLADLITRTQEAVTDIRRLVYDLRPPTLDELGLVPALQEHAFQYTDQSQTQIHVEAPACLPPLPAAVEVALFRIAQEALTNVMHHAHASQCTIRLTLDEHEHLLVLEVSDNGQGLAPNRNRGVGFASMRERAEELGGTWTVEQLPTGGTCVRTHLPTLLPPLASLPESEATRGRQRENI
jgi:signal transduction histidine kinase